MPLDPPTLQAYDHPKNVILLIGDGMGLTQISAGLYSNGNFLNLEAFPVIGLHKAYSSSDLITDSAAGATAFASGIKTYNGAIGVNAKGHAVPTILEEAEAEGLSTGMVTTSTIVHATPAAFAAHRAKRNMFEEIASDLLRTEIDLLIGGGKKYFDQREKDERNLYQELLGKGYQVSDYFTQDFQDLTYQSDRNLVYFTANEDPLPRSAGRDYLVPASKMAPVFLKGRSKKGFFLMIEGAQIDWAGHANNADYLIDEMIEFDEVVGEILAFARQDGETLVILTADHETGGLAINPGSSMNDLVSAFTTDYHTGSLVPVFAYGPGSELFAGIYENTDIYYKMKAALGLDQKLDQ